MPPQKTGYHIQELRSLAIAGRIPVTKEAIDSFVENLEMSYPQNAWLSPLLRVFAEQNMTVSQAKQGKKSNTELFRAVAREIVTDIRGALGLEMKDVEQR